MKEENAEQLREGLSADREAQEAISLRAYEIYQRRGGAHGRDLDDWLQAENEVLAALTEPTALGLAANNTQTAVQTGDTTRQPEALLSEAAPRKRKGDE
ncbi:MAG: DUF2934 domain-containing protein [Acidobacteria bacterium]|nr:DUF2934 domain-containing protein [Acidobacteriota bacterium]